MNQLLVKRGHDYQGQGYVVVCRVTGLLMGRIVIATVFPSGDSYGDACFDDFDGDGVLDKDDVCPVNPQISRTDFSMYQALAFDTAGSEQEKPLWKVSKQVIRDSSCNGFSNVLIFFDNEGRLCE